MEVKLAPGTAVGNGRYTVGGEINRGGTAVVYEGFDTALNIRVALKVRKGSSFQFYAYDNTALRGKVVSA